MLAELTTESGELVYAMDVSIYNEFTLSIYGYHAADEFSVSI